MVYKVGVYGSAVAETEFLTKVAELVGEEIYRTRNSIITGACKGLPFDAVKKLKKCGGFSIGYTSVATILEHEEKMGTPVSFYDELIMIPADYKHKNNINICKKYRNVASVADCDAAIFISGRWGTLNEFAIAYDMGKVVGVVDEVGKFASQVRYLINFFNKKTSGKIIFDKDPVSLVHRIIQQLE